MIIDESTSIKNRTARRTKNICKLGQFVKYKRILTGSPVTKSPLDLFTQCAFLDWKLLGYESFFTYRSRYAVMHTMDLGGRQVMFPKYYTNLDELESKLKSFSYRVRKKDCLDLPDKMYVQRYIDLNDEQRSTYQTLKRLAIAKVNDEEVSYQNKLTEVLKLHQITNGFIKTDDGQIYNFKKNPKLNELMSVLEETEDKCIIWANYINNIHMIKNKLSEAYGKDSVVSIYGEDSVQVRNNAVESFQHDDGCRFLVGNPVVGGYGLTLTAARYVIYFSNSYNLEVRQQSEDRAHRYGQTSQVTYIDLIATDTIDEMVLHNLDNTYITTGTPLSFFVVYHGDSTDADTFFAGESSALNRIGFTNQKNIFTRFNGAASSPTNAGQNCRPNGEEVSDGTAIDGGDGDVSYTFSTDPEILIITRSASGGATGNGGLIRYFNKNGALVCTSTNPVTQSDANFQVKELGAIHNGGSDIEGCIGEIGIYNKTLTDAEAIQLAAHLKSKWSVS